MHCANRWARFCYLSRDCRSLASRYALVREVLQYAKLHGTLSDRESLVFTFEQMARLVVDATELRAMEPWIVSDNLGPPSLIIVVGYGFWDPDLRPLLLRLVRPGSILIRNERPQGQLDPATRDQPATPEALSGPAALQDEFFQSLAKNDVKLFEYRSPLMGSSPVLDRPSILTGLRKVAIGLAESDDPPSGTEGLPELKQRATELLRTRFAGRESVFLAPARRGMHPRTNRSVSD